MNILSGSVHITMLLQTTGTDENCRLTEAKAAMDLKKANDSVKYKVAGGTVREATQKDFDRF